jgi:RHH-type proline utilization regulon transcriptional repressor/proline dehydrogenase/delta 1-pyrroline-5-carboxylate dehydrogenase
MVRQLAPAANAWPEVPQIDRDAERELPRVNVSLKLSALDSRFNPVDAVGTCRRVASRLRPLLRLAQSERAFVNVDMESYQAKDLTIAIFQSVLAEDEFRSFADVGIVIQAYLRNAESDLKRLLEWSQARETPVWVRLVKGAYWDYETVHARAAGWPVPVFEQKWRTDAQFERLTRFLLTHHRHLRPAIASHNVRSLAHAISCARHLGLPPDGFELQLLYGMGDPEKQGLVDLGHRVRIYMPFGELIPGMAYLVRRLLENTSNDSFLRASFSNEVPAEVLLRSPDDGEPVAQRDGEADGALLGPMTQPIEDIEMPTTRDSHRLPTDEAEPSAFAWTFKNEPLTDFALEKNRQEFSAALGAVRGQFEQTYLLQIGDEEVDTGSWLASENPSHRIEIVGEVAMGRKVDVDRAVAAAQQALADWSARGALARAGCLHEVAELMRARRFELAAWILSECGKGWQEADADVAEAIDFCEYYAESAVALEQPHGMDRPGEENEFLYLPRGVTAVVAPWNFPLAILTGMTTAALATGNTVIMKPAEQTSVVGAKLAEIFAAAGLPAGVVNFLPGRGDEVGSALVDHPDVAVIAFTGSREVGLAIHRRAAEVSAGGRFVKRVIAEMGGKNAILIDDDADLDEAVLGVVQSTFGYAGQKCSACSRAVVLDRVYDAFLQRLTAASASLQVGPAEDPSSNVGPVIDSDSRAKIQSYLKTGRQEGREVLATNVRALADEGYYVGPHIFTDVSPTARIAQEEIFGPVLAVIRAADFDEALRIVNGTDYALTGGVYSRSPAHLAQARREILVGNLYLNRPITGAMVGCQPFGGFKLSGIGSKAGGHDYLLQFVVPRTVTENTLRRGFEAGSRDDADRGI